MRFTLLQDLNAYFSHKELSPSSFYNILKKLEKKGLTTSIDKGRNIRTVEATPLARQALKMVSLFTLAASFDLTKEFAILEEVMIKEFDISHLKSLLFVSMDRFYLVPMIKMFSELEFIETLYVLADEEILERYFDRDAKNIQLSTTLNSVIREPNDFFEATFIYRYRAIEDFYGMSSKILLREAVRITKPEQPVILVSWTGKEQLDNSIVSSLIEEIMSSSPFFFEISKHEVIEDMKNAGISEPKIYDLRGGFLAWGRVPLKKE